MMTMPSSVVSVMSSIRGAAFLGLDEIEDCLHAVGEGMFRMKRADQSGAADPDQVGRHRQNRCHRCAVAGEHALRQILEIEALQRLVDDEQELGNLKLARKLECDGSALVVLDVGPQD